MTGLIQVLSHGRSLEAIESKKAEILLDCADMIRYLVLSTVDAKNEQTLDPMRSSLSRHSRAKKLYSLSRIYYRSANIFHVPPGPNETSFSFWVQCISILSPSPCRTYASCRISYIVAADLVSSFFPWLSPSSCTLPECLEPAVPCSLLTVLMIFSVCHLFVLSYLHYVRYNKCGCLNAFGPIAPFP